MHKKRKYGMVCDNDPSSTKNFLRCEKVFTGTAGPPLIGDKKMTQTEYNDRHQKKIKASNIELREVIEKLERKTKSLKRKLKRAEEKLDDIL